MPGPTKLLWDGISTSELGMNDGLARQRLGPGQLSLLINGTSRGDYATSRPGIKRVMTVLASPPGFHQHTGWYRAQNGQEYIMVVCAGRFYRVDPINGTVLEITIPGDANPFTLAQGWSCQGEMFWIYNDGQTLPFIFAGGGARRAGPGEIRPGTAIAYVQGRLWYALPDGYSFRATDLVGNPDSGTAFYGYRDSILHETENTYLNEGGDFNVPTNHGQIVSMSAPSQIDTGQGQGPLLVGCEIDGFTVNTPVDRTVWKDVTYPIQTESLIGVGNSGQQSTVRVNGDVFFRDPETAGIRSFIIARRDFRDWGNTDQSFEVSSILNFDQLDLLKFSSGVVYDKRFLTTCSPVYCDYGVYHRGIIALDLTPISSIKAQGTPNYDGLWTGLNILTMVKTVNDVYLTVLEDTGAIALWKLTKDELYDDGDGRIEWSVIPRQLFNEVDSAERPGRTLKRLETAELEYDELLGTVDFKASWCPDSYPCFTEWTKWQECVVQCADNPVCPPSLTFNSGYQPRKRLPSPPNVCIEGIRRPLANFYSLGLKLDVTGPARLLSLRAGAHIAQEPPYEANTCVTQACVNLPCCGLDYFTYRAAGSEGPYGSGSGSGSGDGGSGSPTPPPTPPIPPEPPPGGWTDNPYLIQLNGGPTGETPTPPVVYPEGPYDTPVMNGWTTPFSGIWISNYAITKITDDPQADGLTAAQFAFWCQLIVNEWNTNPPVGWSEAHFAYYWVDPYFGYWGDLDAKFATGNPVPASDDEPPEFQPGPFWALAIVYR